ncbi:MAG: hypothetical protein MR051_01095 [Lentisphaeria bacterium]|nr:hypothetical protein [Lentisphaeria bacterium]
MESEKVFAFDVGTGSLGIAFRKDLDILKAESLLLPSEAGSLEEVRDARRQYRTRIAHAAREAYWVRVCMEAGIEVLHSRISENAGSRIAPSSGDPRLEREFATPGDNTVYTSCLLRIKLLRGEKLEGWQVFKAVRSAFQRRGFDPDVPWKNRRSAGKVDDESDTEKRATEYEKLLRQWVGDREEYLYPCYFDAIRMGLWEPDTDTIRLRPAHVAQRARGFTPPRKLVIAELRKLLENAARLFPGLSGKTDEILFGPGREQYASYYLDRRRKFGLREGGASDWESLLGQKIPKFDNRKPGYCALIPRLHVCQADDVAVMETTFLLKLKSLRFTAPEGKERVLPAYAIKSILDAKREMIREKKAQIKASGEWHKDKMKSEIASCYRITKTDLKKFARTLGWEVLPGNDEVEAPKISGRSRFSRPGAKIMRELVLSGESPRTLHEKLLKSPPAYLGGGDLADDLKFLLTMPDSWDSIYVPDMGLAKIQQGMADPDAAVRTLIAEQRSPLIRLRLKLFDTELKRMLENPAIGRPDRIVIELVRTDFVGAEKKAKIEKEMKERRRENEQIRKDAEELGYFNATDLLKMKLLKEQGNTCPYTGVGLSPHDLDVLEIDHIVPRHGGKNGSDSFTNKVVTLRSTNEEKGPRTPYEYLRASGQWTAYTRRVMGMKLSKRKQRLLLSPDAETLDQKYADLCSTAWIARVFRDIAMLRCGWRDGAAGEERRVLVVNGAVTAALRRRYRIDSLLAPGCRDAASVEEKNRKDKRHHALDAMVLTFATFWMRDPAMRDKLALPDQVDRYYFGRYIDRIVPHYLMLPKSKMEQTIYGKRVLDGKAVMTKRESLESLGLRNNKFDPKSALTKFANVGDRKLREFLQESFNKADIRDTAGWKVWCAGMVSPDTGMPVRKVRIFQWNPDEYKNFSKDGDTFRGQYRRGAQHKGQFIYLDVKGKPRVAPVYAHASVYRERERLLAQGFTIVGFFQSGCNVELRAEAVSGRNHAMPGVYMVKTIKSNRVIVLFRNAEDVELSLSAIPDIINNLKRC